MNKIESKIIADSISPQGHRITTFLCTYPRFIHGEIMTHRMFSRNSASSRAIPFKKMIEMVENDPFIPIAWQKDHKGMQGNEYLTDELSIQFATSTWLTARTNAIGLSKSLHSTKNGFDSVTKQLCNRLLEPFMWYTCLITATDFENFFELRCPKYFGGKVTHKSKKDYCVVNKSTIDKYPENYWKAINDSQAEIHIQALAESMWDAYNESIPDQLSYGEWHIPFGDKINIPLASEKGILTPTGIKDACKNKEYHTYKEIKISIARCARLSYMTFDNKIDYQKDIELHDNLLKDKHLSPFEHCARVMTDEEYHSFGKGRSAGSLKQITYELGWCNNFHGFIQYRYLVENNLIR